MSEKRQQYEGYLESADLMHADDVRVTIKEVIPPNTEKSKDGKLIERPILVFEQGKKNRMVVGKTNERILKAQFGAKTAAWVGQGITIGVRYLEKAWAERNVPCIRIIPPPGCPVPWTARQEKNFGRKEPWSTAKKD